MNAHPTRTNLGEAFAKLPHVSVLLACWMSCAITVAYAAPPIRRATLPSASPDGRQIVYVSGRDSGSSELDLVDVATNLSRRLTYSNEQELVPGWTADGTSVVYGISRGDTLDLRSVHTDGSGTRTVASRVAKNMQLSRDGRRVAWTAGSWTRNRIWVSNVDGTRAHALTDSSDGWFNLAWSPGDHLLAVTRMDSTGSLQIWLVHADSARARELVRLSESEGRPQWPAWSPDGQRIAFQAGRYDRADPAKSEAYVCVVDVESGSVAKLRNHVTPLMDETPSWLGNDRIVFQSSQSGQFEVWVMKADGTEARQLTQ